MAYETVTGYCWPQSAAVGERVALHLSSAGGRPVSIEVARVGAEREVVYEEHGVPAGDHPTPTEAPEHGCGWPVAIEIDVDPSWRSGYHDRHDPVGTGHQHLARVQRLRRSQPLHRCHTGVVVAADGAGLPVQATRRGPTGDLAASTRPP